MPSTFYSPGPCSFWCQVVRGVQRLAVRSLMLPSSKQQWQKYARSMRDIICSSSMLFAAPQVTESVSETESFHAFFSLFPFFFSGLGLWLKTFDSFCRRKDCRHEKPQMKWIVCDSFILLAYCFMM